MPKAALGWSQTHLVQFSKVLPILNLQKLSQGKKREEMNRFVLHGNCKLNIIMAASKQMDTHVVLLPFT